MTRRPPAIPLDHLLGYLMRRISAAGMERLAQDLSALRLRTVEATALIVIKARPSIRPIDLAGQLGMQRANATPLIAGLEQRQLVERQPLDRRSVGLSCTALGEATADQALGIMAEHDARMFAALDAHQLLLLRDLLGHLRL